MSNDSSKVATPKAKQRHWGVVAAILIALGSILVVQIAVSLLISLVIDLIWKNSNQANNWLNSATGNFVTFLVIESLAVGFVAFFIHLRKANFWKTVGFRPPLWKDLGYGLVGFLIYFGIATTAINIVSAMIKLNSDDKQNIGFSTSTSGTGLVLVFISLVILVPFAEEITFRGFLYGSLRANKLKVWIAVLTTSLVFGCLHVFTGADGQLLWTAGIDTFVMSMVQCNVRERTGSIWGTILIHGLKNCLSFLTLFVFLPH